MLAWPIEELGRAARRASLFSGAGFPRTSEMVTFFCKFDSHPIKFDIHPEEGCAPCLPARLRSGGQSSVARVWC